MVSPAEEKRQEEKRVKELRDFQRSSPANRRCFDCNEMMPQYVCLDFNTFVCTACSGIHREFSHRVKSISASKFTESEVKTLVKLGGNEAAQKYWRAKHDPSFRPSGGNEGDRTRNFIRLTYIDRKWVYESPRESKKEDPKRTGSATGSSRNKSFTSSDGDDFFSSSSSKKKAAPSPTFDAFGSSTDTSTGGGFASFGDFSSFGNEPAKASTGFADFGNFDSASSSSNAVSGNGFGDFGDFAGSSKSSSGSAATPTPAPAVRGDFGSFKLAPPPGSSFSSSSSSSAAAVPAVATPPAKQAPSDFMAFSPDKVVKDPFGFDEPPAAKTASHPPASPFDAFGAPAPASTGSRGSSSSFDAFGSTPSPAPAASSVFDAFGSSATATPAATPFDAFGASSSSSTSSFDAFGASPAAPASQPFDAFGGSSASASTGGFGDFAPATPARSSSGSFPSASVADPFSAFSPRVSSGTNKAPEPASAADPFAAFDGIDPSASPSAFGAGSSTGSFGAGGSSNNVFGSSGSQGGGSAGFGLPGSNAPVHGGGFDAHAPSNDPFAFAGNGGSKSSSFSNPGAGAPHQPSGSASPFSQGFAGAGANPYQQQQQHPQQVAQNANQMYNPMFMQQPAPHQQGYQQHPHQIQQQQQQQWYGHSQQQQQHIQPPGQFPGHSTAANGGVPSTIPVHAKPAAPETPAINDPFAALNIGLGSSSQATSNSRGNSFEQKKPSSASGSFSNGQPGAPSPFQPHQTPAGNAFGGGFPVAGGSRGNSFEAHPAPAFGAPMSNASPMSSFSYPQPQAAFPGPSQSPLSSFSTPGQNTSQHSSFTDNAFGAFTSAPRTDSLKGPASSAAPANPFDMF